MSSRTPFNGRSTPPPHETNETVPQDRVAQDRVPQDRVPQDRVVHDPAVEDSRVREARARDAHVHDTRSHGAVPAEQTTAAPYAATRPTGHEEARDRFGGINWGAAFFGWLVAVGLTILLTGIVGAVAAAVSDSTNVTQSEAERQAGTIGIVAGIVLLVILALAYYAGGYVAGRMSRFDGVKQGVAVWLIGLVVTLLVIGVGALFGDQYNIFDRVNLPRLPISTDELSTGGIITAVAVLVGSLLAAMLGGKVGHRYHNKVDRVVRG